MPPQRRSWSTGFRSRITKEDLRAIIDLFIQEARNHARLVHPNIVDVHQVFEDNNTAYIAMDFIKGCDLLDYVENT